MPTGRLFEVVDRPRERWTFLEPQTLLYLSAFADAEAAQRYAELNGYAIDEPPQIRGSAIDAAQPAFAKDLPAANSAIPDLRSLAPKKSPPKPVAPSSIFKPFGTL